MIVIKKTFNSFYYFLVLAATGMVFPSRALAACSDPATFLCLNDIYQNILGLVLSGASIAFFIMVISGGIKWLTSSGDPKDIENAKGRITFAVFGLVLMIIIWFVLKFLRIFTGVSNITQFQIP